MPRRRTFAALAILGLLAAPATAQDQGRAPDRTISISASGSMAATPDRAVISTGVMTEATTARDALSQNTAAMKKVLDGLKALRIDAKDVQTTAVQLNPRYADGRGGRTQTINGYQALNQVRIIVREINRLGELLDQSVTLGANQMGGVTFEVTKAEELRDDARKAAMVNARRRAELYATAAGVSLGPVLAISETVTGGPGPGPRPYARAAMAESVPVEPGQIDLTAHVHVTYALK